MPPVRVQHLNTGGLRRDAPGPCRAQTRERHTMAARAGGATQKRWRRPWRPWRPCRPCWMIRTQQYDSARRLAPPRSTITAGGPDAQLGLVAWREQQLLMADRDAATYGFKRGVAGQFADALVWQRRQPTARWLLVEGSVLSACVDRFHAREMGNANRRRWWLPTPATRGCH